MFGDMQGKPQVQDQDLWGFVLTKFLANCSDEKRYPGLDGYLAFARRYLTTYPPVTIKYLASGLGVQLTSGEVLAFTADQLGIRPMVDEGVSIIATKESIAHSTREQSKAAPDTSVSLAEAPPAVSPKSVHVEPTKTEEAPPKPEEQQKVDERPKKPPHNPKR